LPKATPSAVGAATTDLTKIDTTPHHDRSRSEITPTATILHLAANIANARASTGPRTDASKQSVARNAIRHGLFARFDRLRPDDETLVQTACGQFRALYPSPVRSPDRSPKPPPRLNRQ
jgi:hypothetical protein